MKRARGGTCKICGAMCEYNRFICNELKCREQWSQEFDAKWKDARKGGSIR